MNTNYKKKKEYVPNTISMDGLKKMLQGQKTLK
jgi:hypothetical protein